MYWCNASQPEKEACIWISAHWWLLLYQVCSWEDSLRLAILSIDESCWSRPFHQKARIGRRYQWEHHILSSFLLEDRLFDQAAGFLHQVVAIALPLAPPRLHKVRVMDAYGQNPALFYIPKHFLQFFSLFHMAAAFQLWALNVLKKSYECVKWVEQALEWAGMF